MQAAICFFSVNAKSNPRGWAKTVIGSAPCCFRGLVSVSNNAMLEERPMAQGILLWRQWPGCGSVGSVVYLLSICHLFFSLFYHSSPISKGKFCFPALRRLVFPLFFHEITRLSLDPSHRTQINCLGGRRTMSSLSSLMLLSRMKPETKAVVHAFKHVLASVCFIPVWSSFVSQYAIKNPHGLLDLQLTVFPQGFGGHIIPN